MLIAYFLVVIAPLFAALIWVIRYQIWIGADRGSPKVVQRAQSFIDKAKLTEKLPNMVVVMPIYNEEPDALTTAVESVTDCVYPSELMAVYLSFDSAENSPLYLHLMKYLTLRDPPEEGWPSTTIVYYKEIKFTVNRFPHGGKRNTQALTFAQIKEFYETQMDNTLLLFIDSDIVLYEDCIVEFGRSMFGKSSVVAMTGFISPV